MRIEILTLPVPELIFEGVESIYAKYHVAANPISPRLSLVYRDAGAARVAEGEGLAC